jgi:hypothetical protein
MFVKLLFWGTDGRKIGTWILFTPRGATLPTSFFGLSRNAAKRAAMTGERTIKDPFSHGGTGCTGNKQSWWFKEATEVFPVPTVPPCEKISVFRGSESQDDNPIPSPETLVCRHCEERSDAAISGEPAREGDFRAALARTEGRARKDRRKGSQGQKEGPQ